MMLLVALPVVVGIFIGAVVFITAVTRSALLGMILVGVGALFSYLMYERFVA
jgi:hypothetical protein